MSTRPKDPAAGVSPVRRRVAQATVPGEPAVRGAPHGTAGGKTSPQPSERQAAGIPFPGTGREDPAADLRMPSRPGRGRTRTPAPVTRAAHLDRDADPGRVPGNTPAGASGTDSPPAGSRAAVTRLAALPPWPAPPGPGDVLLQIRLGIPPVTESRARISPAEYTWIGGRRVKTKKAHGYKEAALAEYQETVGWLLRQCRVTRNDTDQLGVYGVFHLPAGAGAADGDNLLKAITDAGNGIAWKDDRQFTLWLARVIRGSADPHTDLVVYVAGLRAGAA